MAFQPTLIPRQIWANPPPTSTTLPKYCTPYRLPSGGALAINDALTITLTREAVFQPLCTSIPDFNGTANLNSTSFEDKDPFYSSTLPEMYAIAAVTVVSYLLVIILFITPRTFFVGGSGGGGGFLGRRGMISGGSRNASVIGVGGRPWLQKIAALTVAISLTIASVDTFKVAERQYALDYSDAQELTSEVVNSLEILIVRIMSETFLWLAQAQTLIRLFPRHKEKVIIKWAGFVLIGLDTIFSILNSFVSVSSRSAPRKFQDAIPALSYLFTLSLNLIYAAWIIYYSLSKRRYAFFHPKMRNICLVALLSYVAVLIPVVFFILDISIYDVAGWGNYVRWVGAAAASVVVWEWVERIEALERDERKDGILGREIFDGDEMLETTPSSAVPWSNARTFSGGGGKDRGPTTSTSMGGAETMARRFRRRRPRSRQGTIHISRPPSSHLISDYNPSGAPQSPRPTASPFSPFSEDGSISPDIASPMSRGHLNRTVEFSPRPQQEQSESTSSDTPDKSIPAEPEPQRKSQSMTLNLGSVFWNTVQRLPIPFLHRHMSPPIEVKQAVRSNQPFTAPTHQPPAKKQPTGLSSYTLLDRIGFKKTAPAPRDPLPVTVVPAPSNNRTSWSDVRSCANDELHSRPMSPYALTPTVSQDVPMDQQSRRSTPVMGSVDRRRSGGPSQVYRMSRGTMTPMIMEDDGLGEQVGVMDADPLAVSRERHPSNAEEASPGHGSPTNATNQGAEEKHEYIDSRSEPPPSRRRSSVGISGASLPGEPRQEVDLPETASHIPTPLEHSRREANPLDLLPPSPISPSSPPASPPGNPPYG